KNQVKIGKDCYIAAFCFLQGCFGLEIGDYVSIAPGVKIFSDSGPNVGDLTKIYPMKQGKVIISDHAWIGANVVILPGVEVGSRSVIATNSVVSEDVPPGVVVGGIPAKFIKKINMDILNKE
ncbi:hypothetical protein DRH27_06020, partial [Candidatus Falkowbacteria bacterium]